MAATIKFHSFEYAYRARSEFLKELPSFLSQDSLILGRQLEEFEESCAHIFEYDHALGVANGLDALKLGLRSVGVKEGDLVVVPGFSFIASWLPLLDLGCKAEVVDVDQNGLIDLDRLTAKTWRKAKAIVLVNLYGQQVQIENYLERINELGIAIVEDSAQSHGLPRPRLQRAEHHVECLSFYPTKNLGGLGDGGMLLTDNSSLASRVRSLRSYGSGNAKHQHSEWGWNSRLDPIQALYLQKAITHLEGWNHRRMQIAEQYTHTSDFLRSNLVSRRDFNVWHHFPLEVANRDYLRARLFQVGVETDTHYPYTFRSFDFLKVLVEGPPVLPRSEELAERIITLPIYPSLATEAASRIAVEIDNAIK